MTRTEADAYVAARREELRAANPLPPSRRKKDESTATTLAALALFLLRSLAGRG